MDFTLLIIIIVIALLFDLVNGFHDAANSIATVVSTKVLTPTQAVVWAAAFNIMAFLVFDMSVGNTFDKTVADPLLQPGCKERRWMRRCKSRTRTLPHI